MTTAANDKLPVIATIIGDPAGIGPEICIKALASGDLDQICESVLIGDLRVLERAAGVAGVTLSMQAVSSLDQPVTGTNVIRVLEPCDFDVDQCPFGKISIDCGNAVLDWLEYGSALGASGAIQGLVMAPLDSGSIKLTGRIAHVDDLQPPGTYMFRMGGTLRVVPLTEHLRLSEAIERVNPDAVLELILLLNKNLVSWGIPQPRIAVAGINPHAMFPEDQEKISPAIEQAQKSGINVSGPVTPDAVFRMAMAGKYDAVVTMFHDQGQIAIKTASFEGACTVYLGLPYVMLNVPHGSAFDIAGTGTAQHKSILTAMKTAAQMAVGSGIFSNTAG